VTSINQSMTEAAPSYSKACKLIDMRLGQPRENFIWFSWGNYNRLHILADSEKHGVFPAKMNYSHLNGAYQHSWRV